MFIEPCQGKIVFSKLRQGCLRNLILVILIHYLVREGMNMSKSVAKRNKNRINETIEG